MTEQEKKEIKEVVMEVLSGMATKSAMMAFPSTAGKPRSEAVVTMRCGFVSVDFNDWDGNNLDALEIISWMDRIMNATAARLMDDLRRYLLGCGLDGVKFELNPKTDNQTKQL